MARFDMQLGVLVLESTDPIAQIREVQAMFPPVPSKLFTEVGDTFKLALYKYRWSCVKGAIPSFDILDDTFNSAVLNGIPSVKSFFERLAGAGKDVQLVYRAFKDWFQISQIQAESFRSYPELKSEDIPTIISVKNSRSLVIQKFQKITLSSDWGELPRSEKKKIESQRDLELDKITPPIVKILFYNASHLSTSVRGKLLMTEDYARAINSMIVGLIRSELTKYYKDPCSYKVLVSLS